MAPAVFVDEHGIEVEAVLVETAEDVREIRALEEWHDGQIRILTYPTHAPVLFVGVENDVALLGRQHVRGQYLVKGPAGDIEPMPAVMFDALFVRVTEEEK